MLTVGRFGLLLLATGAVVAAVCFVVGWTINRRRDRRYAGRSGDTLGSTQSGHVNSITNRIGWVALMAANFGGWLAVWVLATAFIRSDWRLEYVTDHARAGIAWPLRVGGVWAGPEGSLLLWSSMTATAGLVAGLVRRRARSAEPGGTGAVGAYGAAAIVAACHSASTVFLANPFETLDAPPAGGTGLQPVLEHPAMVWHPPLLYAGLIAMMIPAGLALSSTGPGRAFGPGLQRSMLWALALLTAGLATGANWAYVELGWGGYWAWDPIENAGLIAWLVAAAGLHRFAPGQTGGRAVTVVAVLPAVGALWATTITRTGVLSSVHSFANQPGLRAALLVVAGAITVSFLAAALTSRSSDTASVRRPRSRDGAVVLAIVAGIVALGTYQPAVAGLFGGDDVITGPGFYALMLWPLVIAGAVARVGAALSEGRQRLVIGAAAIGALVAMAIAGPQAGLLGLVIAAGGGAVVGAVVSGLQRSPGGRGNVERSARHSGFGGSVLAHVGIGVLLIGVGGALGSTTDTVQVATGVTTPVAPGAGAADYEVLFEQIELIEGNGVRRAVATVQVDGRDLHPELVSFVRSGATSVETATDRGWLTDVQVSLVDADAERAIVRISRQPRMSLIWLGVVLITSGFAASAIGSRSTVTDAEANSDEPSR